LQSFVETPVKDVGRNHSSFKRLLSSKIFEFCTVRQWSTITLPIRYIGMVAAKIAGAIIIIHSRCRHAGGESPSAASIVNDANRRRLL
jgi:hypothetical protein